MSQSGKITLGTTLALMSILAILAIGFRPCTQNAMATTPKCYDAPCGGDPGQYCPQPWVEIHQNSTCITQGFCLYTIFGTCTIHGDFCSTGSYCEDS